MSKSPKRPARAIRCLMLCGTLSSALSACVQAPPVFLTASDCKALIPSSWRIGVSSAPLPQSRTVGDLAAFGDAQTGQLDIANNRFADAMDILGNCEELLKQAGQQVQPKPWYQFW